MYSLPVHIIPKPDSDMMCLVVDHSSGDFSPNLMIMWEDIVEGLTQQAAYTGCLYHVEQAQLS